MPFQTNHFNANQKVWVVYGTGDQAAYCCGKYRGKGRYVRAWVRWATKARPDPEIKAIEVADAFAEKIMESGR